MSKALAGVDEMTTKLLVVLEIADDTPPSVPVVTEAALRTRAMEEILSCLEYDPSLFDFRLKSVSVTEFEEEGKEEDE